MGNRARYRRRRRGAVTPTLAKAEAVEVLVLGHSARYAATHASRRSELTALVTKLHARFV
jgi:hypothetical protein